MALTIGDLRNDTVSVFLLPKLDVAGSSPVARTLDVFGLQKFEVAGGPHRPASVSSLEAGLSAMRRLLKSLDSGSGDRHISADKLGSRVISRTMSSPMRRVTMLGPAS
jgi:hypothetical protein